MSELIRCLCGELFDRQEFDACPSCGRHPSDPPDKDSATPLESTPPTAAAPISHAVMPRWVWGVLIAALLALLAALSLRSPTESVPSTPKIAAPESVSQENVMTAPTAHPCTAITGRWAWFTGGFVTFDTRGTAVFQAELTGPVIERATWRCDSDTGAYSVSWSHGFTDSVEVSEDGNHLGGVNQQGTSISGQRVFD